MYCFFTTVPVAFYWTRSDETVHGDLEDEGKYMYMESVGLNQLFNN